MSNLRLVYYGQLPGLNELISENRRNKYAGAKQKKVWRGGLASIFRAQMIRQGIEGVRKHATIHIGFFEPDRRRDDDNVFGGLKLILDAMQDAGVIIKDSPRYCHILPERFYDKGNPRVEIEIEEDE